MIAHVRGTVSEKSIGSVVVDVAGIGYQIQVALSDYEAALLNEPITFYTHHHVREQANELFGFSTLAAKNLFELLIGVQGVGPKAALSILSLGPAESVRSAIASKDTAYVSKASGVGKKTAERVIVDIADKVGLPTVGAAGSGAPTAVPAAHDEALEALMALGYTLADAAAALEGIDPSLPTGQRVREALRQ